MGNEPLKCKKGDTASIASAMIVNKFKDIYTWWYIWSIILCNEEEAAKLDLMYRYFFFDLEFF